MYGRKAGTPECSEVRIRAGGVKVAMSTVFLIEAGSMLATGTTA